MRSLVCGASTAGAVNWGEPNEKLLVVTGTGELRGANINPFWILRWLGQSCNLLLATAAHHLEFLSTKTHGLPDVQIGFASSGNTSEVMNEGAHPGASHRVVKDELILAVAVQRRFARKGDPDRTRVVPENEPVPPDTYELHFLDEAGKDVAAL